LRGLYQANALIVFPSESEWERVSGDEKFSTRPRFLFNRYNNEASFSLAYQEEVRQVRVKENQVTDQTPQDKEDNRQNPEEEQNADQQESSQQPQAGVPPQKAPPIPSQAGMPPAPTPYTPPAPLSLSEERTWAMVSHLSILANLVTAFLGPLIPLVIYLTFKDRSRYVAFQSMQAFIFQLIAWIGAGLLAAIAWTISGLLVVILIGCLIMPLALLISIVPLAALVYGVIGAIQTDQGQNFKYWLVGDWTLSLLKQ
jgi:uncharacterized Tic20 family protein